MPMFPIKGWPKGVDNIHAGFELADGALRSAVNVDILDSGKVRLREGSTSAVAASSTHSLWSHEHLANSYYVAGGTLYSLSPALVSTAVVSGLSPGNKVAYVEVNGEVFWSNGITSGKISGGVNYPWGVETPARVATLSTTTGGLPPGRYQVTTTFRSSAGEEGGALNAEAITLTAAGGISMSNLPPPAGSDVTSRCIYASLTNGDVVYKVATIPSGDSSYTLSSLPAQTVPLRTMDAQKMPVGTLLAHRYGVLYVAVGPVIYHSEPMRYGQCVLRKNFYLFPEDVSIMLAAPEGLYVCADRTVLLEAPGTQEVIQKHVFPFGGVKGTGVYLPNNTGVAWFSPKGQVLAVGGQVSIPSEKLFVPAEMSNGATVVREQNGIRQIINVANTGDSNSLEYTGA